MFTMGRALAQLLTREMPVKKICRKIKRKQPPWNIIWIETEKGDKNKLFFLSFKKCSNSLCSFSEIRKLPNSASNKLNVS